MDSKYEMIVWLITALGLVAIMITATYWDINTTKIWAENGYEQVMLPGSNLYKWQKAK